MMLVNPNYKASGGSPTPSSGYVEEGLLYMANQGNNALAIHKVTQNFSNININSTDGWSAEICYNTISTGSGRIFKFDSIWVGCIQLAKVSDDLESITVFTSQQAASETISSEKFTHGRHTISITNEDTNLGLYFDGELISTFESPSFSQSTGNVYVGVDTSSFTLHNFRLYTRALTAAEIAANHANDVAKYGGNG